MSTFRPLLRASVLSFVLLPLAARAQVTYTAFAAPNPNQLGSQNGFSGTIGEEFTVGSQPIEVTALGAFDSASDGLTTSIVVSIYDVGTQQSVGTLTLGPGTVVLNDGYRFADATALNLTLAPNTSYRIAASGFNGANPNGNVNFGDPVPVTDNGGGLIASFGGSYYDLSASTYPNTLDSSTSTGQSGFPQYLGGSFQFNAVPEPSTWAMAVGGLGALVCLGSFRRRLA